MKRKYPHNTILNRCLIIILFILLQNATTAQVRIKGPECVLVGQSYQYVIEAKWDTEATMQICVTGGKLKDGKTCSNPVGKPFSSVYVVWDESDVKDITVRSSKGNFSLTVKGTKKLNGGNIAITEKFQHYKKEKKSYIFKCSAAAGGSCTPLYNYQWQQSVDGWKWTNIEGATSKDFSFNGAITTNIFFRRMVTDNSSRNIAFSEMAQLIFDRPKRTGDSLYFSNGPKPKN